MSKISKRDRVMLMALPAAVILFIYGFFFAKPKSAELKELKRQAGVLETRLPKQGELLTIRRQLGDLRGDLASLQRSSSGNGALGQPVTPEVSLQADAFFETLLSKHQLIVINETSASTQDARSFSKIVSRSPGDSLWEIELAANYTSVAAFLADLGQSELPLTPVAVEMIANFQVDTDLRLWNLWIYR